jgi:hypothetical protein
MLIRRTTLVVLLMLCSAIVVAWIASHRREDRLLVSRAGRCCQAISKDGSLRIYFLYDYPIPLPWIWEYDDEGRPAGRRMLSPKSWRGEGGTVEFFPKVRTQNQFGPIKSESGFADSDSSRKELQQRRLPGISDYVSVKPKTRWVSSTALPHLSDAEIQRSIKADPGFGSIDLNLSAPLPKSQNDGAATLANAARSDEFSLTPPLKRARSDNGGAPDFSAGVPGLPSAGGQMTIAATAFPRYAYDEFRVPYWLILLAPLTPLMVSLTVKYRRRRRRRARERMGLCLNCGYDLRSTAGACPECGMKGSLSRK